MYSPSVLTAWLCERGRDECYTHPRARRSADAASLKAAMSRTSSDVSKPFKFRGARRSPPSPSNFNKTWLANLTLACSIRLTSLKYRGCWSSIYCQLSSYSTPPLTSNASSLSTLMNQQPVLHHTSSQSSGLLINVSRIRCTVSCRQVEPMTRVAS